MKSESSFQFLLKAYLMPGLVVLVIVLMVPFALLPVLDRIKDQSGKLSEAKERLTFLEKKQEVLARVDEDKESKALFEAEIAVPSDKKLSNLVVGIGSLVSESGASMTDMTFVSPGEVASKSAEIQASSTLGSNFKITLKGDVNSLKTFLQKAEKSKRILTINAVNIRYNDGNYEFEVDITAPYRPLRDSVGNISDPIPELTSEKQGILDFISNELISFTNFLVPEVNTGNQNPF